MQAHHVADTKELVEAHRAKRDEPDGRTKAPGICELDPPDSRIRRQPCLSEKRVTASEYSAAKLRLVLYAAGSVRAFVTDALWDRGIRVSGAHALNAVPVAEYSLAVILFSPKHGWRLMREPGGSSSPIPGTFGATVGLVSLGAVGRLVRKMLRPHQLKVLAYDPFLTVAEARRLDVHTVDLDELFRDSDVVSRRPHPVDASWRHADQHRARGDSAPGGDGRRAQAPARPSGRS